jgi:hypothetical protein
MDVTVPGRPSQAKLISATGCELTIQHIKSRRQEDATTSHARDLFDGRVFRRGSHAAAAIDHYAPGDGFSLGNAFGYGGYHAIQPLQ